jgi:dihydrofolate reductase
MISPRFSCVVAADLDDGIGKDNDLPWPRLSTDLRTFKRITSAAAPGHENALVMGRLTWESIPPALRPLPGRRNVVVSRGLAALPDGVWLARSLDAALAQCAAAPTIDKVFVIGGGQIYAQAFAHPACDEIVLTRLQARFACDTFIPPVPTGFALAEVLAAEVHEAGISYAIERWRRAGG